MAESMNPDTRRKYTASIHPCNGCESQQLMVDDWAKSQRQAGFPVYPIRTSVTPDWR